MNRARLALLASVCAVCLPIACQGRRCGEDGKLEEARTSLREIARLAVEARGRDGRICPSASRPVPLHHRDLHRIPVDRIDRFYPSIPSDWAVDAKTNSGFACLRFKMQAPQFFQYSYEATPTSFVARARGDMNANDVLSTFEIHGRLEAGVLVIDPKLVEIDPNE